MMTLYSRAVDARCHRVRFVLAEKALATRIVEADLLVTVIRFVLMRVWIFRVGTRR